MTKEVLKKNIEDMEIYLPISTIEKNLGMPKTTIQQVLNGHRKLPKKWIKFLEVYFKDKVYLGVNNLKFANSGEKGKLEVVDNGLTSKIDFKPSTKDSFDGKKSVLIYDEMEQYQSVSISNLKTDISKVSFTEKQIAELVENSKPPRLKGESSLDYKIRIAENK